MSLAQHVSATEGIDREPYLLDVDTGPRLAKKLSYDLFPHKPDIEEREDAVGAFEVSTAKRIAQVTVGLVGCVLASGVIFGFAALKPVLIREGVYADLCEHADFDTMSGDACYKQDLRLNLVFTVASVTTNVSSLPVGTFFDRYGPRKASLLGCLSLAVGCILMAFSTAEAPVDCLMLGYVFLALGGSFIFIPSFHLANAFPRISGLILALVTGAFDASAVVLLGYRLIYEATDGWIDIQKFFLVFLIVPVFIFVSQVFLMPELSYKTEAELKASLKVAQDPYRDVHSSDDELESEAAVRAARKYRRGRRNSELEQIREVLGDRDERMEREQHLEVVQETSGVWGALHGMPAHEQMRTMWFILLAAFTVFQMLRMTFFIATVRTQYEYMLQSRHLADAVNDFFDFALPIGGSIAVPFIGFILDYLSTFVVLLSLVSFTTLIGILGAIRSTWAGYANVSLFVLLRPFYYSTMSDYATKVFGFATFGRVYGTIICISGICSFLQSGLDATTHIVFNNNPIPVNLALTACNLVIGVALAAFVGVKGREVREEQAKEEADGLRQSLLISNDLAPVREEPIDEERLQSFRI